MDICIRVNWDGDHEAVSKLLKALAIQLTDDGGFAELPQTLTFGDTVITVQRAEP